MGERWARKDVGYKGIIGTCGDQSIGAVIQVLDWLGLKCKMLGLGYIFIQPAIFIHTALSLVLHKQQHVERHKACKL